jgi:glycosyltransferase involved in cell wall biosynthesis
MRDNKLSLSISIISFNEEENIGICLESIKDIATEIIVVDSGSTDKTIEIAKSYGASVFIEDWKGYVAQKNSALKKCTMDWILCLDCDEVLTGDLKKHTIGEIKKNIRDGYYINRRTYYLGKLLKFSWQPDYILRLVKRGSTPVWSGYEPHTYLTIMGSTSKIGGDLIHYSYKNVADHIKKLNNYSKDVARSYYKDGKSSKLYNLLFNPAFAFTKKYFLKLGFLDGIRGFFVAVFSAFYVFLKYCYLWELKKAHRNAK